MTNIEYIYDDPVIDRRGTNPIADNKLFKHYKKLFRTYKPACSNLYRETECLRWSCRKASEKTLHQQCDRFGQRDQQERDNEVPDHEPFKYSDTKAACIMFQNDTNMKLALSMGWVKVMIMTFFAELSKD